MFSVSLQSRMIGTRSARLVRGNQDESDVAVENDRDWVLLLRLLIRTSFEICETWVLNELVIERLVERREITTTMEEANKI